MWRLIIIMIVGFGFFVIGLTFLRETLDIVDSAVAAKGTVIDITSSRGRKNRTYYRPVVRFVTSTGTQIEFTSGTGTTARPTIGDTVEVLYDPQDPQHAEVNSFMSLWFMPVGIGGMGVLIILVSTGRMAIAILRHGALG